ncbi:hypothetical protein IB277_06760 [Ensifer sp. ENS07]|uniref:hypothetical protein n=1 Tax=Ensifer sp. ENS07 TaxID=2769274 RepID=UPI00178667C3|nr:hypothetical protein [Ensifer sp. ENS07]MBD9635993.1 hypothetical protein [Ensifer sp. ENS07]
MTVPQVLDQPTTFPVICLSFVPVDGNGGLRGFADFQVPRWRLRLIGCAAFHNANGSSIALPGRPKGDGFAPTVAFDDPRTHAGFVRAAIAALDAYRPDWRGRP